MSCISFTVVFTTDVYYHYHYGLHQFPTYCYTSLAVLSDHGVFLVVTRSKYSEVKKFGKQFAQQLPRLPNKVENFLGLFICYCALPKREGGCIVGRMCIP